MAVRSMLWRAVLAAALAFASVPFGWAQMDGAGALVETPAAQAIVIDGETGAILFEKNADQPFPPASLAKLMTLELVFGALRSGLVSPDTTYPVSENAWRTGGAPSRTSTMFAEVRSNVPVEALMRGVAVQSANDASIVLAEGMEGTEAAFAQAMNERAAELGLAASRFVNATGLPADGQETTVRDMAVLARHIASAYPDEYAILAEPEFTWNGIRQRNRNPLLSAGIGATGGALGFTEGLGFSIVGLAQNEGRRTIVALAGLESDTQRSREGARLLEWAEANFRREVIYPERTVVGRALVYGGARTDVALATGDEFVALVPREAPQSVSGAVIYDGPLRAPVARGDQVGRFELRIGGHPSVVRPLFAAEDVARGTFSERAVGAVQELAFGWIRSL